MRIWQEEIDLNKLAKRHNNTLAAHLGIEFIAIGDDYLVAQMKVDEKTKQPKGIMHGGASCALVETVGSVAANYCVDAKKFYCVGLEINLNHLAPVSQGFVVATAKPFHLGKRTQVWGIEVKNTDDKLVSVGRLTLAVLVQPGA